MIYINARFLTQNVTGVQRFAVELSKQLLMLRNDIIFLVPNLDLIIDKSMLSIFNIKETKGGSGHFWEQITLPKYLKSIGCPLLINLCNTAPVLYKQKITVLHDINFIKYSQSYSWKFRLFYKNLIPLLIKTSCKIITVSNFSKNELSDYYQINTSNIAVIYNATSEIFNNKKGLNQNYALAVSSPVYHKNFSRMIEAFLKSNANIDLKIIGSLSDSFNSLEYNVSKDPRVEFLGRVTDDELVKLYQNANFFIFPSLYEGFGIPPLEAQACGCAVISSNAASLPEVLQQSALYFDPCDVEDIKNKIEQIASNSDLTEKLSLKGLENVKRFSWKKSAIELNQIINSILN
ncbi:glycosyltransferase family 4 protein [Acinetobacter ursingii]|uniref:glycosyltransferase family 4 protein n=1 Tax=Acinetobacter ursingii TaxID=108980 RepID=UPI0012500591|nr:glycosyltransferase family 1 protein [Acinetobacter ursingii]